MFDNQCCCVKSLNCCHFLFQASDEILDTEMSRIGETELAEITVDSDEFYDENDDQANYSGTRGRILFVYLQFLCYIDFIVSLKICFMTIFSFL